MWALSPGDATEWDSSLLGHNTLVGSGEIIIRIWGTPHFGPIKCGQTWDRIGVWEYLAGWHHKKPVRELVLL
jgi:hypothetical protein